MLETGVKTKKTVYAPHAGSVSFLSDDIQNLLLYWRDKFKQGYFEIGDVAAECISQLNEHLTNEQVFAEIAKFCGKSPRTVRYYYETAVFYPQKLRDQYAALPFSHFVLARAFTDWRRVLEYAQEHPYIGEDALRSVFINVADSADNPVSPENDTFAWVEENAQKQEDNPAVRKHMVLQAISNMRDGMNAIRELLSEMSPQDRLSYSDLLYQIEQAIEYLPQVIEKFK
jgi:hypothetical protein